MDSESIRQVSLLSWRRVGLLGTLALLAAYTRSRFRSKLPSKQAENHETDERLRNRVRDEIDLFLLNPETIHVEVIDRVVHLRGSLLAGEASTIRHILKNTQGIDDVVDKLEIQYSSVGGPELQAQSELIH